MWPSQTQANTATNAANDSKDKERSTPLSASASASFPLSLSSTSQTTPLTHTPVSVAYRIAQCQLPTRGQDYCFQSFTDREAQSETKKETEKTQTGTDEDSECCVWGITKTFALKVCMCLSIALCLCFLATQTKTNKHRSTPNSCSLCFVCVTVTCVHLSTKPQEICLHCFWNNNSHTTCKRCVCWLSLFFSSLKSLACLCLSPRRLSLSLSHKQRHTERQRYKENVRACYLTALSCCYLHGQRGSHSWLLLISALPLCLPLSLSLPHTQTHTRSLCLVILATHTPRSLHKHCAWFVAR